MPSISDLNVRLGLIYKDFDKGLESVERKLRASGRRLSDLGDQLTVAISIPLAAAGAAAVKSAGDIESLQLALESQLGSAEKARKELELLRQEALKPGLGFEQAVRASVSLQAVGFSAEKARKITSEFGNALALAGKGAQELDGVVLALTQITAKGIVSAEEINQIAERLPQIRTLMQQAFGTASTEAIQKMGITSQQFIEGITTELQKLPRATGGIKNSLENFFDAIKVGASKFGFAIAKAVDLPQNLESLSAGLSSLADGFASLNPNVQQYIVYAGAAFVATGPLVKVFGAVKGGAAQMIDVLQGAGLILKNTGSAILGLTEAVNRLKLAMGIVGIVAAVGAAVYVLSERFDAAAYSQQQFAEASRAVYSETAKEIGALDRNFAVLKNVASTNGERKAAIDALLQQYPQYLKGINLEIQSVDQLSKIQNTLTESIQRSVAERKKAEALNNIYGQRADILQRIQQLRDGASTTVAETTLINTGDTGFLGAFSESARRDAVIKKLQAQANELDASAKSMGESFDKAFGLAGASARRASPASQVLADIKPATDKAAESTKQFNQHLQANAKTTKEVKSELDKYLEGLQKQETLQNKIRQAAASMGLSPLDSLPQTGTGPVQSVGAPQGPEFSSFAEGIVAAVTPAQAAIQALNTDLMTFNELFTLVSQSVTENGGVMSQAVLAASQAMQEAAANGESNFKSLAAAAIGAAAKIVRAYIQQGVAAAVAKALAQFPFPANIAIAGAAGALAGAAFNKLLSAIKVPGFALGTEYSPKGMALVGERGPELVNLPRGSKVVPNNNLHRYMGDGNNVHVQGTFRIAGSDLVVVLEKQQSRMNRTRGF